MSNKRQLRLGKYGINPKRYKELCGFCEQYPEWKKQLTEMTVISAVDYTGDVKSANTGTADTTGNTAINNLELISKCNMIEQTARDAVGNGSPLMVECLIKCVCYEVPYYQLDIPYSASSFYEYRRYFFYLLDKRKKI